MKKAHENIFLIGPMGAGKTSVGRYLAKRLNMDFYDSDEEIERTTGASLGWIFDLEGLAGYRERERRAIDELSRRKNIVLSTGGGCVETEEVRDYLRQRGVVVYMEVSLQTQLRRLEYDKKRPLLQGENPQEVLMQIWEKREPYYEEIADFIVVTDKRSISAVCDDIFTWLGSES